MTREEAKYVLGEAYRQAFRIEYYRALAAGERTIAADLHAFYYRRRAEAHDAVAARARR